jgi:hypothetical protein
VPETLGELVDWAEARPPAAGTRLEPLVREWLMDLQVLGCSPKTIKWYRQKMDWYLRHSGAQSPPPRQSNRWLRVVVGFIADTQPKVA